GGNRPPPAESGPAAATSADSGDFLGPPETGLVRPGYAGSVGRGRGRPQGAGLGVGGVEGQRPFDVGEGLVALAEPGVDVPLVQWADRIFRLQADAHGERD